MVNYNESSFIRIFFLPNIQFISPQMDKVFFLTKMENFTRKLPLSHETVHLHTKMCMRHFYTNIGIFTQILTILYVAKFYFNWSPQPKFSFLKWIFSFFNLVFFPLQLKVQFFLVGGHFRVTMSTKNTIFLCENGRFRVRNSETLPK